MLKLSKRALSITLRNIKTKTIIIAELGLNHNGDLELAKDTTEAAFEAGADIVKFQNFKTEDFLKDKSILWNFKGKQKSLYEICKSNEFQNSWFDKIIPIAKKRKKKILSTPTSESNANILLKKNIDTVKNGSDFITHLPLLKYFSKNFQSIILSTGMATFIDIKNALNTIERFGAASVLLLHCCSLYPTPHDVTNLNRMLTLRKKFNLNVGFSDHTKGWFASVQAVSMGSCLIEKHFTLNKKFSGPDHWFSSDFKEFATMVKNIKLVEKIKGDGVIDPGKEEFKQRDQAQISLSFKHNVNKNITIKSEHFDLLKTKKKSLKPVDLKKIVGKKLKKNKRKNDSINLSDVK